MNKIIDFDDAFNETGSHIRRINQEMKDVKKAQLEESEKLDRLLQEISGLKGTMHVAQPNTKELRLQEQQLEEANSLLDDLILDSDMDMLYEEMGVEVHKRPKLLPKLSRLDMSMVLLSGALATVIDFLVVRIPKDTIYLNEHNQKGSDFTRWLSSLGVNKDGKLNDFFSWLEKKCRVPYDQSISQKVKGMYPKNHRLLSLGHDPLFGLFFAVLDIHLGTMTAFDTSGALHMVKSVDTNISQRLLSPLLWIGHLASDMCTKAGLPIPGWGFMQLMQFGSLGDNERTIAEISGYMYLKGYDLRHFLTMSLSVASVEIIIRGYCYLRDLRGEEDIKSITVSLAEKETRKIQESLRLHKMLFLANAMAASGNAIKVFSPIYNGNPTAINLPQWLALIKESVIMLKALGRDTTVEKVMRNRENIDINWEKLRK